MTTHIELKDPKKVFFITGATGFLGSQLAVELVKQGYSVVALARAVSGDSGKEKFRKLCGIMDTDPDIVSGVRFVEGDITLPGLGLDQDRYHELKNSVSDIINCAADTSFTEKRRELVELTNIQGLKNLLDLAVNGVCSYFHQVSTAYVFGKTSGTCEEELTSPCGFTNVYEETKCIAEHIVSDVCGRAGIRFKIYRPGIVCGESRHGKTFRFNGLYYPLKSIQRIIENFRTDIFQRGGEKTRRMGVRVDDIGRLFIPLTIRVKENSGINIIPVDYFVRMFIRVMEDKTQGRIFHIVQKENSPIGDIIEYTGKYFNIEGLNAAYSEATEGSIERIFNLYNEAYLPYLEDKRVFSSKNTSHLREYVPDDRFTYDRFKLCMDYAVKTDWGKQL